MSAPNTPLTAEALEAFCLSLPGASVSVQWGNDRVFKVGGKMFAVLGMQTGREPLLSFKCPDMAFALLIEQEGVRPAPYLARAKWVQLDRLDRLAPAELAARLTQSHALVAASLPKRLRPS